MREPAPDLHRPGTDDDAPPVDPAESLRLIAAQRAEMARSIGPDPLLMYGPWGVAWLVSYGAFFLRFGPDGRVTVPMPEWLPGAILAVVLGCAALISWIAGARASRHIVGPSSTQGLMYGISWFVAFGTMMPVTARFARYLSDEQAGLLFGAVPVGLVAILYVAGSAIWRDWPLFWLGIWLGVVNVVGVLAGPGWHSLIVSLAGGGAMLSVGVALSVLRRRRM